MPGKPFKVYLVWVPVLEAEERHVSEATRLATDPRVRHFWDGENRLGDEYRRILGLSGTAWDVYMLFDQTARWPGDVPPTPAFWMHQLSEETTGLRLDPAQFSARAQALLEGSH
jgi:hypothetical protein